tara:strand:+ start:331 stop:723 length:393 start_codon:yes stop_codon:yes gene_type:complete
MLFTRAVGALGRTRKAWTKTASLSSNINLPIVELTGATMSCDALYALSQGHATIALGTEATRSIGGSRAVIDGVLDRNEVAYGINTGFGLFSNVVVAEDKLVELQENLIRSHSAGVGTTRRADIFFHSII